MKVKARCELTAFRVCWENLEKIRLASSHRCEFEFSSTYVRKGSEGEDEPPPYLRAKIDWGSTWVEATHGEYIIFGDGGSINTMSASEFAANYEEVQ